MMINIRSKLVMAFVTIVVITVISSVISLFGYIFLIDQISNIDKDSNYVYKVNQIEALINKEHRVLTGSIVNLSETQKSEFLQLNSQVSEKIRDLADDKNVQDSEKTKLAALNEINGKFSEIYQNNVLLGVAKENSRELAGLYTQAAGDFKNLLNTEETISRSISQRIDQQLDDSINAAANLKNLTVAQKSAISAVLSKLKKINTAADIKSSTGTGQALNKDSAIKYSLESIENSVKSINSYLDGMSGYNQGVLQSYGQIKLFDLQKNLSRLLSVRRLMALTHSQFNTISLSIVTCDEKFTGYRDASKKLREEITQLKEDLPREKKTLDEIVRIDTRMDSHVDSIAGEIKRVNSKELQKVYENSEKLVAEGSEGLDSLKDSFKGYLNRNIDKSKQIHRLTLLFIFLVTLVSIAIGMVFSWLLPRKIIKPIKNITSILERAEHGDLTIRAQIDSKDEIGELTERVNSILDGQKRIVGEALIATRSISSLKQKLVDIFHFSRSNLGTISADIRNIEENAVKGAGKVDIGKLASDVKEVSESTGKVVNDGIKAMEIASSGEKAFVEAETAIIKATHTVQQIAGSVFELDEFSGNIGAITNTITEIASRTNLLALNAAIEAAKAGQQGRGFTILAEEIRKLSEASNKSASDIKNQIRELKSRIEFVVENMKEGILGVEDGVSKMDEVKASINGVISSVKYVVNSVKDASELALRQTDSADGIAVLVEDIQKSVSEAVSSSREIDRKIEDQSKIISEMEAMSGRLDEASKNLTEILGKFKV